MRRKLCAAWTGWEGVCHFKQDDQQIWGGWRGDCACGKSSPGRRDTCQTKPSSRHSLKAEEVASVAEEEGRQWSEVKSKWAQETPGQTDKDRTEQWHYHLEQQSRRQRWRQSWESAPKTKSNRLEEKWPEDRMEPAEMVRRANSGSHLESRADGICNMREQGLKITQGSWPEIWRHLVCFHFTGKEHWGPRKRGHAPCSWD